MFIRICWRDMWRNKRRTLLTGLTMSFAVMIMVLFIGLGDGAHLQMINSATDSFLGHVQVQKIGYQENQSLENSVPGEDMQILAGVLDKSEGVHAWAQRIATGGLISKQIPPPKDVNDLNAYSPTAAEGTFIVGIDPLREQAVSTLESSLLDDNPRDRCLNGCRGGLAQLYIEDAGLCSEVCPETMDSFQGDDCGKLVLDVCNRTRCSAEDDCDNQDCVDRYSDYCIPTRFIQKKDPYGNNPYMGEIVLGSLLAKILDLNVGDRVVVTTGTATGRSFASAFRVAGLIKTGSLDINRSFGLVNYEKLAGNLDMAGAASFVVIRGDPDSAARIAESLRMDLKEPAPQLTALGWAELSPELDMFVKIDQGSLLVMLVGLVMIVGVILANIVTMAVMERTREYGVRLALGEKPGRISTGLLTETLLLSLLFSLIGAGIGEAMNYYFQINGIDFGMGEFETTGVILSTVYYSQMTVYGFLFSVGTVVSFSVLGALYPAWRIRKISPVDAIRFQ